MDSVLSTIQHVKPKYISILSKNRYIHSKSRLYAGPVNQVVATNERPHLERPQKSAAQLAIDNPEPTNTRHYVRNQPSRTAVQVPPMQSCFDFRR